MKLKSFKRIPVLVAIAVIAAAGLARGLRAQWIEKLEAQTLDWRIRLATEFPAPALTNLGFVYIQDQSIARILDGSLGYSYGLYWPRQLYGRLLRELAAQGAKAVGFDIIFAELRPDHSAVAVPTNGNPDLAPFLTRLHGGKAPFPLPDGDLMVESDDFFAWQMRRAGMAMVAADEGILPHELFRTNALAIGDIAAEKDSDGVLRRARAFKMYRHPWHPLFQKAAQEFDIDLRRARVESHKIVLVRSSGETIDVPLDRDGNFDVADFVGEHIPAGMTRHAKPFSEERIWHMGIMVAARELKFDLTKAEIDLKRGRITLRGEGGVERIIPVDAQGYFYIDWSMTPNDPRLTIEPVESLLQQDNLRWAGQTSAAQNRWQDKLVVVGSVATGNDLTDRGATPLEKDAILVSKHWNVANSIITDRFVRRSSLAGDVLLIGLLGALSAILTWQSRALAGAFWVVAVALAYMGLTAFLYVQHRYWLPLFLPVAGALILMYVCLVTWRVVFEEKEKRRVRSIFSRVVSPNVVRELLGAEKLSLGGARREITVFFADVRGFTELTDRTDEKTAAAVQQRKLTGAAAEALFDQQARETLDTVNTYLGLVAGMVKKHNGTLDKYIGDCVMAFWGAPTPNTRHALACVRAAIDAQRAVDELNRQRVVENQRCEQENARRAAAGLPPRPLLPILTLGTGINTGVATVGLMGSEAHGWNYTVFGREVNLASRLENLSGRARIFIGATTYTEILRDDPALAATCLALPPVTVKGIREAVKGYEVPWKTGDKAVQSRGEVAGPISAAAS